jgi:hypothetical protein
MKKTLFFVTFGLLFTIACDKIFLDIEGKEADLQGKWQMDNVDTVYYNFQKNLFQYQIYRKKEAISSAFGYYTLKGDTAIDLKLLREYAPLSLDHLGWDTLFSSVQKDTIFKAFKIEKITSKKLILSSDKGKIAFHKFG